MTRPKLDITVTLTLEEALALRDLLRSFAFPRFTVTAGPDTWYLQDRFRKLYQDLRDNLPPLNYQVDFSKHFYGSSGQ